NGNAQSALHLLSSALNFYGNKEEQSCADKYTSEEYKFLAYHLFDACTALHNDFSSPHLSAQDKIVLLKTMRRNTLAPMTQEELLCANAMVFVSQKMGLSFLKSSDIIKQELQKDIHYIQEDIHGINQVIQEASQAWKK